MPTDKDFQRAVEKVGRALNDFVGGDATAYKECWLQQAHVSIFGRSGLLRAGLGSG